MFSTESNLNSLKCFLGVNFDFAKCPFSGLFILLSFTSPNPNCIALYPSVSTVLTCATTHGPASITVTGITNPYSSNIWVIPIFFPIIPGMLMTFLCCFSGPFPFFLQKGLQR